MGGIHIGETYYDDKVPLEELIFAVEKLSGNDPQKPPVQDRFSFRKNVTKSALEIAKPFLPLFNKLNKWASSLQQEDEITYFDKLLQKVKGASCQEKQRAASEIAEQKHISPLARQVAIKLFEDALVGYEEEQSDFLETFPDTNKDTFLPAFVSIKANLATLDPEKYLKPAQEFFKEHYQRLKGTMGYKERGGILEKITGTVSDMYERLAERVKESDPTLHWRYTQQWQKLGVEHLRIKTGYMQDKHADAVNIAQHCVGYTRVINEDGSNGKKFATDYDWECLGIYAKQDNIAAFVHKDTALRNISALKRYHAEDQPIEVGLYGATSDSKQGSLENLCTALEQLRAWGNVKIVYANVLKPISEMNPSYTIDHKTLEAIAGSAIPQPNDYLGNTEAFMWSYLDTPTSYNAIEEATKDKGVLPIWISKYKLAGILQEESHKVSNGTIALNTQFYNAGNSFAAKFSEERQALRNALNIQLKEIRTCLTSAIENLNLPHRIAPSLVQQMAEQQVIGNVGFYAGHNAKAFNASLHDFLQNNFIRYSPEKGLHFDTEGLKEFNRAADERMVILDVSSILSMIKQNG